MGIVIDKEKLRGKLLGKYGGYEDNKHHKRIWWNIGGVECGGVDIRHGGDTIFGKDLTHIKRKLNLKNTKELKIVEACSFGREILLRRLLDRPPLGLPYER